MSIDIDTSVWTKRQTQRTYNLYYTTYIISPV